MAIVQLNLFDGQTCRTCERFQPLSAYCKNRGFPDGLNKICRDCTKVSAQRTYLKNHESRKARLRAIYWRDPERARADKRKYHAAHPDLYQKRKSYYRKRYQENRADIRAYQSARQRAAPELGRARVKRHNRLKGHKKIHGWPALRAWFGKCCLCCGSSHRIEADHVIPLAKGGSNHVSNIQPLCRICNAEKATQATDYRDPERLAAFLAQLE